MNPLDLAWAAGFIDGDGCISGAGTCPSVTSSNTDKLLLVRLRTVLGTGTITGPYARPGVGFTRRAQWRYQAYGREKVQAIVAMLWPWLGAYRRAQAARALGRGATSSSSRRTIVRGPEDVAWAAGFFDAEGSFSAGTAPLARILNTDLEQLERFRDVVGFGPIYGPSPSPATTFGSKDRWTWAASSFEAVQALAALLWIRLGRAKRDAARRVLRRHLEFFGCGHERAAGPRVHWCPECSGPPGPKTGALQARRGKLRSTPELAHASSFTRVQRPGHFVLSLAAREALGIARGGAVAVASSGNSIVLHQPHGEAGQVLVLVGRRGYLTIPKERRDAFGAESDDLVAVTIKRDHVVVSPVARELLDE